jgi:hypothetical protein
MAAIPTEALDQVGLAEEEAEAQEEEVLLLRVLL